MTQNSESGRPSWDFDYAPLPMGGGDHGEPERDLVLATAEDIDSAFVAELLGSLVPGLSVLPLFCSHPIFWTRIEATHPIDRRVLEQRLTAAGVVVRYIASARQGSQRLPPSLDLSDARPRRASGWKPKTATDAPEPATPWRWFLRERGIDVVRGCCGTGAGTRLAVIDNDGRDLELVKLDAEVLVGVEHVPRAQSHAALMLGWTVGAKTPDGGQFRGVAPDASPRLYCIPKPGEDVWAMPLAIVQAADDGADVIVCATYVEGTTSPLLDDALEFATRLGRGGRGTAVVMPTGREMSSPPNSTHSSLSLGLADPGSDPRVFCVGASARDGSWFLWRDRRGKLRPFANRGPSVRWLAPGDDVAFPFSMDERPCHAESSGASGLAAGALLLLLGTNPDLSLEDLNSAITHTAQAVEPGARVDDPTIADRRDLEPLSVDDDGHNAKHGYGRVNAASACLFVRDPLAQSLIRIGERAAAERYLTLRERAESKALYSDALSRWAARALLRDRELSHAFSVLARAVRLYCWHPDRADEQPPGHLLRQLCVAIRLLTRRGAPPSIVHELEDLEGGLRELLASPRAQETEARLFDRLGLEVGWTRPDRSSPASGRVVQLRSATGPQAAAAGPAARWPGSR